MIFKFLFFILSSVGAIGSTSVNVYYGISKYKKREQNKAIKKLKQKSNIKTNKTVK